MAKTNPKRKARLRRKRHIRKSIFGTTERPRLSVFRSNKHIYAQIIDDVQGCTLVAASSMSADIAESISNGGNRAAAEKVGTLVASRAKEKGISEVVFDRNGYLYHGRVASLAQAARDGGLVF